MTRALHDSRAAPLTRCATRALLNSRAAPLVPCSIHALRHSCPAQFTRCATRALLNSRALSSPKLLETPRQPDDHAGTWRGAPDVRLQPGTAPDALSAIHVTPAAGARNWARHTAVASQQDETQGIPTKPSHHPNQRPALAAQSKAGTRSRDAHVFWRLSSGGPALADRSGGPARAGRLGPVSSGGRLGRTSSGRPLWRTSSGESAWAGQLGPVSSGGRLGRTSSGESAWAGRLGPVNSAGQLRPVSTGEPGWAQVRGQTISRS